MTGPATAPVWTPSPATLARSRLARLSRRLAVEDHDELLRLALAEPAHYWRAVMDDLGLAWFTPYETFCDLAAGPAHPAWFTGGRLNWVHNALRHAGSDTRAHQPAMVCETEDGACRTLGFAELDQAVRRVAGGLRALGLARGDRVGLMLPMGPEAVIALLAIAAMGAIAVPLFTGFGGEAARARLGLAGARALIATTGCRRRGQRVPLAPGLAQCRRELPGLAHLVLVEEAAGDGHGEDMLPGATPWAVLARHAPLAAFEPMGADDPFMIMFTSGTSGVPKGTVHTHGGFPLKVSHDAAYHFDIGPGDRWLWPSDMGWVVGPLTTIAALTLGATLVCYDGAPDMPDWSRLGALIARRQVTHFGASPTLIRGLAAHADQATQGDLSSLRLMMAAGEVLDTEHFLWLHHRFGQGRLPLINYTGGTEAAGALLASVPVRPIRPVLFNSASPGVAVSVRDEQGRRVRGQPGELCVDAPFIGMSRGFWQADAAYVQAYWSRFAGLWAHGDLAREEVNGLFGPGQFELLGRADDTLKIAGKRVGPGEVEALLLAALPLLEAAAVGLPDAAKGQRLVVCLVPRAGTPQDLAPQAMAAVEAALGKPFRPAAVHLLPELPKTRNGKLMRRLIRSLLLGTPPGDLSALANPDCLAAFEGLNVAC